MHDGKADGAGYFVGYESKSRRRVGFIGLSGFRPEPLPIEQLIPVRGQLAADYSQWSSLPDSIYWGASRWRNVRTDLRDLPPHLVHVPSGNDVRLVDLAARTVKTVFHAAEPIESLGIPFGSFYVGGARTVTRLSW